MTKLLTHSNFHLTQFTRVMLAIDSEVICNGTRLRKNGGRIRHAKPYSAYGICWNSQVIRTDPIRRCAAWDDGFLLNLVPLRSFVLFDKCSHLLRIFDLNLGITP